MQGAINFALQSSGAKGVKLVLFTEQDLAAGKPTYEITLDPVANKTGANGMLSKGTHAACFATDCHQPSNQTNISNLLTAKTAAEHQPNHLLC